jgi:ubiquitin-protein ligase E3 C
MYFRSWVSVEKESRQNNMFSIMHSDSFEIRREYLLEDAFEKLYGLGSDIKNRLRIQFVDVNYVTEEGVDGGGLFKEFITKLTEIIFNPQYAFFTETHDRKLYPNYLSSN